MSQVKLRVVPSTGFSGRGLKASLFVFLVAFFGLARETRAQGPWEAIDIGTMFDGWDTIAHAVNDRGQVVGLAQAPLSDGTVHRRAFVWTPATGFVDLGHLGKDESMALGINNAGQLVGRAEPPPRTLPTERFSGARQPEWSTSTGRDSSVRHATSTTRALSLALVRSVDRTARFGGRRPGAWSTSWVL